MKRKPHAKTAIEYDLETANHDLENKSYEQISLLSTFRTSGNIKPVLLNVYIMSHINTSAHACASHYDFSKKSLLIRKAELKHKQSIAPMINDNVDKSTY